MNAPVLRVEGLTKRYGRITAIEDLHLDINAGAIHGILGPNGSGKTTTLGMVMGIIQPNAGSYAWFGGVPNPTARKRIGCLLETPNFFPYLDADENLRIVAHIKGDNHQRYDDLLELVNLKHRRNSLFRTYSLGMKQRLAIAATMIGDPEVLILDEPTNGLDPQGIAEVRHTIRRIGESGKTIIMASHILNEVERVCTDVSILRKGRLISTGAVSSILDDKLEVQVTASDLTGLQALLAGLPWISKLQLNETRLHFEMDGNRDTAEINRLAFEHGIVLQQLVSQNRSLETAFLTLTAE